MNERLLRGLALGMAGVAVAVVLAPSLAQAACPAVRRGMKAGFIAYLRGREAVAGFMELVEDAYAEATAELKQEADAMAASSGVAASPEPNVSKGEAGAAKKRKRRG
jgi:hypothetical protein